ncbi:MAG: DNA methyltransferase [Chromatiaceae bacterium]
MTPDEFIRKWQGVTLTERASSQEHFIDLCHLLGEPTPTAADPQGVWYAFEKGARKAGGGDGWADVWRRGCFGWEYKGPGKDLAGAFRQLQLYTPALEYPPLLIVSDIQTIEIHTAFTGLVPVTHRLTLEDLRDPAKRVLLKWAFSDPERLRPAVTTAQLTEKAATQLGALAQTWRQRGHDPARVAHFCQQVLFCLFAEDIKLLPHKLFTRLLQRAGQRPAKAQALLEELFAAMATGGEVAYEDVDWFNGGLFSAAEALPLALDDIQQLLALAELDWSAIDPTISGTLFVRGLDPAQRAQFGAQFTDPPTILRLINPVVLDPLRARWAGLKVEIQAQLAKAQVAKSASTKTKAYQAALERYQGFLGYLRVLRILDAACGSANFLLLTMLGLKDLEHQVIIEADALGLPRAFPMTGPENVIGIEINPFAAELARVVIWIGEIQWMLNHGFAISKQPILRKLDNIHLMDAILNEDGSEPEWPAATAIVGNPPFLGGSKLLANLGEDYVTRLRKLYQGRVPGGADLVTYWFEKARALVAAGKVERVGLVATNSIRGGANRKVLDRIVETGTIFTAWSDEPWINEGAAVRVSLVAFGSKQGRQEVRLDGVRMANVHSDLTATPLGEVSQGMNITVAVPLRENAGASLRGTTKNGPFDIPGDLARSWLTRPNPHGRPNADVLKPWCNGMDVTRRRSDTWIIDFGVSMPMEDASLYELPFAQVLTMVKPMRASNRRDAYRENWWIFGESRPGFRFAVKLLDRYIATAMVAKHRMFVWLQTTVIPDQQVITIIRADDTTFGTLHSRFHELWSLRLCTWLGKGNDPRYTPTTTFETFPFPAGLTPADTAGPTEALGSGILLPPVAPEHRPVALAIAQAAHRLNTLREGWLNPPEWVDRVPEIVPGYPDRLIPKPAHAAELRKRTLTNLYNARPAWLDHAHQALDVAVAAAYGWADYTPAMPEDEILRRLLALNLARSSGQ